jgi:predicted esterase
VALVNKGSLMYKVSIFILLTYLLSFELLANNIFTSFPKAIDKNGKYVFYSHGYGVEGSDPTPVHERWGIYDFPKVKEALSDVDYNLIAYHRPSKTEPIQFAKKIAEEVRTLISAGVKPSSIFLLGFSKGGGISIRASNELKSNNVNLIIMAACTGPIKSEKDIKVFGNVLSIYEISDTVKSCLFLKNRSEQLKSFSEISINTGKGHGAFYTPLKDWIQPIKKWIKTTNNG